MCRCLNLFVLTFVLGLSASGQAALRGPRSAALAGATSALPGDVHGEVNPAAWAHAEEVGLLLHAAQLYGLRELRFAGALLILPYRSGSAVFGGSTFGFELYRTSTIDAGLGLRMGAGSYRQVSIGLRTRWRHVTMARYERTQALGLSIGLQLPVTPFITMGAAAQNVIVGGPYRSEVPRRLTIGAAFVLSPSFAAMVDVSKDVRTPMTVSTGVEVSAVQVVVFRVGVGASPPVLAGGVGLKLAGFQADMGAVHHGILGWSPSVSVLLAR